MHMTIFVTDKDLQQDTVLRWAFFLYGKGNTLVMGMCNPVTFEAPIVTFIKI